MNNKLITAVFNILNIPQDQPRGSDLALEVRHVVLAALRKSPEQRVIADRYEQHPAETAALLKLELMKLLDEQSDLVETLQGLVGRYETAVSKPSSSVNIVTDGGTLVQGDGNTVIGDGATYIKNSTVNLPPKKTAAEDALGARPEMQQMRMQMAEFFNLNDLQDLCWELGIQYEDLPGAGLSAKVRELLSFCWRNGRLPDLLEYCRTARPHVEWPTLE